jgi:hypothetical protein
MVAEASSAIATGVNALVATATATTRAGPSPLSTFLDRLSLLSPQTWWGLWNVLVENPFTTWNGQALMHSLVGFLLPLIVLRIILSLLLLQSSSSTISSSTSHGRRLVWTTLLSPWTISSLSHILQQLASPLQSLSTYHKGRFQVLPEAELILKECLKDGRATWNRNFVVFWPPSNISSNTSPSSDTDTNDNTPILQQQPPPSQPFRRGIWILPGALVPHIAYAPIAERLSKAGFVVVLQSLEPTRLAHPKLLTAKQLQNHWNHPLFVRSLSTTTTTTSSNNNNNTIQWNILGHSMGSFYCMNLAARDGDGDGDGVVLPIHKIVLWGMASFCRLGTDLANTATDILVIQGSKDYLRDMTKPYQEEFQQLFPARTTQQRIISGGTHDGFASYQAPTTMTSSSSGSAGGGMTRNEQQALACEWTVQFLSNTTRT